MREVPSDELVQLLERLGLATPRQVAAASGRVRSMAAGLPKFDSVWIDALLQVRRITPYQARELKAGRGNSLASGPCVATDRLVPLGTSQVFACGNVHLVRGTIAEENISTVREQLSAQLLPDDGATSECFPPMLDFGIEGSTLWTAWQRAGGTSAAEWMITNGRFPPMVVLHVARQMLAGLRELEQSARTHGNLDLNWLLIDKRGRVQLPFAGLNLFEKSVDHDLISCGLIWWQLLTGRTPLVDGKPINITTTRHSLTDVRELAPDTPEVLAEMIAKCVAPLATDRPKSFAEVASVLGPASRRGPKEITRAIRQAERWVLPRPRRRVTLKRLQEQAAEVAAVAACLLLVLGAWRFLGQPARASKPIPLAQRSLVTQPMTPDALSKPTSPVHPAAFYEPAEVPDKQDQIKPLLLPEGRLVRLASLAPIEGQVVRGEYGGRVRLAVPPTGLLVEVADVRFEQIDFEAPVATVGNAAMIVLRAPAAAFVGCTFRGSSEGELPVAIRWEPSADVDEWSPLDESVSIRNTEFHHVAAVIEHGRTTTALVECHNVLATRVGRFVTFAHVAERELFKLSLDRCTLREIGQVLSLVGQSTQTPSRARLVIEACDSVFSLRTGNALVECDTDDAAMFPPFKWIGRDSLLDTEVPIAALRVGTQAIEPLEESALDIAGLARSSLTFAGEDLDSADASRLRRWVAARRSPEPPGFNPPKPRE